MYYIKILVIFFAGFSISSLALAPVEGSPPEDDSVLQFVKGRLLVKLKSTTDFSSLNNLEQQIGAKRIKDYSLVKGLTLYQFDPSLDVLEIMLTFMANDNVLYAEPDYLNRVAQVVSDPGFAQQWALENTGQTGGMINADINAELMWSSQIGDRDIVIGVIDTGIDHTHPDLIANLWRNSLEIAGNGIDDDGNGYVDDVHGINAINESGNPMDNNGHGTHVAGTIGATGDNGIGVVGVAQRVSLAGCKFLSARGSGSVSHAIDCMQYFADLKSRASDPINLVATNNSWGGGGRSQAMMDAIREHERLGILFIAAAGNSGQDNDRFPSYPASYQVKNVIAVAATDDNDRLASFSSYGDNSVHVAAPGVRILSTTLNRSYSYLSGTSMATPHVAGLAAVIAAEFSELDYRGIKNLILTGGQRIASTANTTISGRRIRGADFDGVGSLTCSNQTLIERLAPAADSYRISVGDLLKLSATHINCASSSTPLTVYQGPLGNITLTDDGNNGDEVAGDGILSLDWRPQTAGVYQLSFGEDDVVTVIVTDNDNGTSYSVAQVPFVYQRIGGQRFNAGDDTMHRLGSPFPINFAGQSSGYTDLYVNSNGTISFTDSTQPGYINQRLPFDGAQTLIAAYWDDLTTIGGNSDIYVDVIGQSPNRQLVIEWWRVRHYRSQGLGAFQVVFRENSPDFQINYLDTNFSHSSYNYGASATVGVQISPENSLMHSFNQPVITSGTSLLFSFDDV